MGSHTGKTSQAAGLTTLKWDFAKSLGHHPAQVMSGTAKTHVSSQMLEQVLDTSCTPPLQTLGLGLRQNTQQIRLKGGVILAHSFPLQAIMVGTWVSPDLLNLCMNCPEFRDWDQFHQTHEIIQPIVPQSTPTLRRCPCLHKGALLSI